MVRLPLPVYVQAVLLPFEGQVIYDGLLQSYAVVFGPGIRARLNEEYCNARECEGIITALGPVRLSVDPQEERHAMHTRNAGIMQAFHKDLSSKGLSPETVEQHVATIENFAQTSLLAHDPPPGLLDTQLPDVQNYVRSIGNRTVKTSFKRLLRFLAETGRMDYEHTEVLRVWLKQASAEPRL